jgi:hypothetical protein
MFSEKAYPPPWNWFTGAGVESCYIGLILFARKKSLKSFLRTALMALLCGVVYNSLHAAEVSDLLQEQNSLVKWSLSIVHGSPLSLLAFSYFLLLHASSDSLLRYVKNRRRMVTNSSASGSSHKSASSDKPVSPVATSGQLQPVQEETLPSEVQVTDASSPVTTSNQPVSEKGSVPDSSKLQLPESRSRLSSSTTTLLEVATNHSETTSFVAKYTQGQESQLEVTTLADFTTQVGAMARQIQTSKLGVREFENRLQELLDGLSQDEPALVTVLEALSSDRESARKELVEQIRRMARQLQKRELGVKEFDRQLLLLVAPHNPTLVQPSDQ